MPEGPRELRSEVQALRTEPLLELKKAVHRLALGIVETHERIDDAKRQLTDRMDKQASDSLGAMDAFAGKAESYGAKALSHKDILQDHEARLLALEFEKAGPKDP